MTDKRSQIVRRGYWITFTLIVVPIAILYLNSIHYMRGSSRIIAYCWIHLILFIPAALITLTILNKKSRKEHTRRQRISMHWAKVIFIVTWLASIAPLILIMMVAQTWPFSIRHGPDTRYAREGFTKVTNIILSDSISDIYYRQTSSFTDGSTELRFKTSNPAVVRQIVQTYSLQETSDPTIVQKESDGPKWWKRKIKHLKCFYAESPGGTYWYLWYDPDSGTVWYQDISF